MNNYFIAIMFFAELGLQNQYYCRLLKFRNDFPGKIHSAIVLSAFVDKTYKKNDVYHVRKSIHDTNILKKALDKKFNEDLPLYNLLYQRKRQHQVRFSVGNNKTHVYNYKNYLKQLENLTRSKMKYIDEKFLLTNFERRHYTSKENGFKVRYHKNKYVKQKSIFATMCPKCLEKDANELITEQNLTKLRIEFVKHQILEKLRLKERPNVSAIGLPRPIYEGSTIDQPDDMFVSKDYDDYFAKTNKKFIFLKKETKECEQLEELPNICFSFKINNIDVDRHDINTAVLWIFKNKQQSLNSGIVPSQQVIVVSELEQHTQAKYLPVTKTIAIQSVSVQDEWMKIDIEWPIKRWFGNHELSHLIQITCQSCDVKAMDEIISSDKDFRPFIMVNTQNKMKNSRLKRSINCSDSVTECCRERLYISFKDIGWADWIIHPSGYDAYFCRGSCHSVASITQSISQHSNMLQKVFFASKFTDGNQRFELTPCCTAKKYLPLQMVYMDSNNTATQKTFPNMIVDSCGCR